MHLTTQRLTPAVLVLLLGLAAGCGDDDGATEADGAATSTTAADSAPSTAPPDTTAPPTTSAPGDVGDLCSTVSPETVAEATGQEVVDTTPSTGTGEVQGVEYRTAGCTYGVPPEGGLEVEVLVDEAGDPASSEIFTALEQASLGLTTSDEFPHQEVAGLGQRAFFINSLLSTALFVDTGSLVLLFEGEIGEDEAPRPMLQELATTTLDALG
jgi:hypothetical protein